MTGMARRVLAIVRYSGSVRLRAASAGMAVRSAADPGVARSASKARSACVVVLMAQVNVCLCTARVGMAWALRAGPRW
eukprot:4652776-Alexandrium_andersonii.AAC.1